MPPIQPNKAEAPIPHSIHAIGFALLLAVSKLPFGTTSANEFVAPWAWILLGFRCFGTMPPIQPNKAEAPIPHSIHAIGFALLWAVSKLPFGTTSANEFVAPWAWVLLGFRCFGTMPPIQPNKAEAPIPHSIHAIGFALLLAVSKLPFGTTSANEFVALGFNPAGVPLFRNHASNPTK